MPDIPFVMILHCTVTVLNVRLKNVHAVHSVNVEVAKMEGGLVQKSSRLSWKLLHIEPEQSSGNPRT